MHRALEVAANALPAELTLDWLCQPTADFSHVGEVRTQCATAACLSAMAKIPQSDRRTVLKGQTLLICKLGYEWERLGGEENRCGKVSGLFTEGAE